MKTLDLDATDLFCGAGGSSQGARDVGIKLRLAMNHWRIAIDTHNSNFPDADHVCADIQTTDPRRYPSTRILIASPECTNHTGAKGKPKLLKQMDLLSNGEPDPAAERSRATMWDVPRFAEYHDYELIVVENVVEAREWVMFDAWLLAMQSLGYEHQLVFANSMHTLRVPQSRDRMYGVFWKRGNHAPDLDFRPAAHCAECGDVRAIQTWKRPDRKFGRYRAQYFFRCPTCAAKVEPHARPASDAIDWKLPSQRIGDRTRPLADKTLARIQAGIDRYWPVTPDPLVVNLDHPGDAGHVWPSRHPLPTQTARLVSALASPPLIAELRGGGSTARPASDPMATICASGNHHGLVMRNNTYTGTGSYLCTPTDEPLHTLTTAGHQSLIEPPLLMDYHGSGTCRPVTQPAGTVDTRDRHGLIERGSSVAVEDCHFRMLEPEEIHHAMGFPDGYVVTGTKRDRVRQYGNAVTPPVMAMILERCAATLR